MRRLRGASYQDFEAQYNDREFREVADREILRAHAWAWDLAQSYSTCGKPQEPDLVAALVLEAIPAIAGEWAYMLADDGIHLSVATVFCHKRPIVQYGPGTNPELGDLLVVHRHETAPGRAESRALLLQAKMSSEPRRAWLSSAEHQLVLYNSWPAFSYVLPASLASQRRDIQPKAIHAGARYLLLENDEGMSPPRGFRSTSPAWVALPYKALHGRESLAQVLTRMLWLGGGRAFQDLPATEDWSRTVWDLLRSSFGTAFKRRNIGVDGIERLAGHDLGRIDGAFQLVDFRASFSPPQVITKALGDLHARELIDVARSKREFQIANEPLEEGDRAISVVVLETSDIGPVQENQERLRSQPLRPFPPRWEARFAEEAAKPRNPVSDQFTLDF
jgi:hypothetical protein